MPELRYAQFCPLARAAEILGHRWTLLVLRELLTGPQRFSDLLGRLPGVSRSVLAERLADLETRGVVVRRELPPPAPATVYELTAAGRALRPALLALARWGLHFLELPSPEDHTEPAWIGLAAEFLARSEPTPERRFELVAEDGEATARVRVAGGPVGTRLLPGDAPVDASLRGPLTALLGLMVGRLDAASATASGLVAVEGDPRALADLPALFDPTPGAVPDRSIPEGEGVPT